jgi:hypothetical protein
LEQLRRRYENAGAEHKHKLLDQHPVGAPLLSPETSTG